MWQTHNVQLANFDVTTLRVIRVSFARALCVAYEGSISCCESIRGVQTREWQLQFKRFPCAFLTSSSCHSRDFETRRKPGVPKAAFRTLSPETAWHNEERR